MILNYLQSRSKIPENTYGVVADLPASTLTPFGKVLRAVARVVHNLKPRDHVTPAVRELLWLPTTARIDYRLSSRSQDITRALTSKQRY